jgi:hypothetical protein
MSVSGAVQVIERFARDVNAKGIAVKVGRPDYWERQPYLGPGDWMQVSADRDAVDLDLNTGALTLHGPVRARVVDDRLELSGYSRAVWRRDHGADSPPETFHDGRFLLLLAPEKPSAPSARSEPSGKRAAFRVFLGMAAALVLVGLVVMPLGLLSEVGEAERRTESATGEVTLAEATFTGKGGDRWVCTYRFTVDGSEFGGKDQCPGSTRAGDSAPVLYEPGDPSNNRAWWTESSERTNSVWGFAVWALLLSAALWGGGAYVRSRRKARKSATVQKSSSTSATAVPADAVFTYPQAREYAQRHLDDRYGRGVYLAAALGRRDLDGFLVPYTHPDRSPVADPDTLIVDRRTGEVARSEHPPSDAVARRVDVMWHAR